MRVLNDNQSKTETPQISFSEVIFWSLLCAIGFSSLFFAPLPVIIAHQRLTDPYSKLAALLGAVVGLLYFELPVWTVASEFVFSLLAADLILRKKGLWAVLLTPVAVVTTVGILGLSLLASQKGVAVPAFWNELIVGWTGQMKAAVPTQTVQWDLITSVLAEQGHFLFVGFVLLSLWISVGVAAHFDALPGDHHLSGAELRKQVPSKWLSLGFLLFFGLGFFNWKLGPLFLGFFRILSAVMFVFGTCALSRFLSRRKLVGPLRSSLFVVSVLLGFYVVVGLGFVSPWAHTFLGEEK